MNFDKAFELLIGHEGGYTTNPKDAGNWTGGKQGVGVNKGTKYGIAANSYPSLDIKNLTQIKPKQSISVIIGIKFGVINFLLLWLFMFLTWL